MRAESKWARWASTDVEFSFSFDAVLNSESSSAIGSLGIVMALETVGALGNAWPKRAGLRLRGAALLGGRTEIVQIKCTVLNHDPTQE